MTLPFEPVGEGPNQHNWDLLSRQFPLGPEHLSNFVLQLAATGTARKVNFGAQSVAHAAATSGTFTITHGLGTTPVVAFALPDGSAANDLTVGVSALGATTFTVSWRRASGTALGTTFNWYWLAIA